MRSRSRSLVRPRTTLSSTSLVLSPRRPSIRHARALSPISVMFEYHEEDGATDHEHEHEHEKVNNAINNHNHNHNHTNSNDAQHLQHLGQPNYHDFTRSYGEHFFHDSNYKNTSSPLPVPYPIPGPRPRPTVVVSSESNNNYTYKYITRNSKRKLYSSELPTRYEYSTNLRHREVSDETVEWLASCSNSSSNIDINNSNNNSNSNNNTTRQTQTQAHIASATRTRTRTRTVDAYYEDGDCVKQQHFHQQKYPKQNHHHHNNTSQDQNQDREQLSANMDTGSTSTASAAATTLQGQQQKQQRQQSATATTPAKSRLLAVEELFLGPVFESSQTVLAAIRALPTSVVHLDLDLRNTLHLIPQAMPLLFADINRHHLKHLSLRVFGDAGAIEVAKWMGRNPNLEHLDLRENRIGSVGTRSLVDAIVGNSIGSSSSNGNGNCNGKGSSSNNGGTNDRLLQLSHLNLSYNCILDGDIIGRLLASNSTLTTLDLGYNWFADRDVQDICQGLTRNTNNTSLRKLNLFGCHRITHVGMNAILGCLKDHNTSLQTVSLEAITEEEKRIEEQIKYWLDLNKAGRCLIKSTTSATTMSTTSSASSGQERVPMGLWPLALEKSKMHPDSIFYLVREGLSPKIANYR